MTSKPFITSPADPKNLQDAQDAAFQALVARHVAIALEGAKKAPTDHIVRLPRDGGESVAFRASQFVSTHPSGRWKEDGTPVTVVVLGTLHGDRYYVLATVDQVLAAVEGTTEEPAK